MLGQGLARFGKARLGAAGQARQGSARYGAVRSGQVWHGSAGMDIETRGGGMEPNHGSPRRDQDMTVVAFRWVTFIALSLLLFGGVALALTAIWRWIF
jgi:hypothetical protein